MKLDWDVETKTGNNVRCLFYCRDKKKGERNLFAQFNPEKLEYEYSATFAELNSPGMNYPIFQYVRGNASEFSVQLFFYEGYGGSGKSIRKATKWFADCLPPKNTNKHKKQFVPPTIDIRYGYYKLKGVLTSMQVTDEWLNENGKPLMTRINLKFIRIGNADTSKYIS